MIGITEIHHDYYDNETYEINYYTIDELKELIEQEQDTLQQLITQAKSSIAKPSSTENNLETKILISKAELKASELEAYLLVHEDMEQRLKATY